MRAQVVLIDGSRILLARHVCPDREYFVLPGGAVEAGETVERAAVREVLEETGLRVEVVRLLFVKDGGSDGGVTFSQPRHTFLGRIVGGELRTIVEPHKGRGDKGYLAGAEWLDWDAPRLDDATNATLRKVRESLDGAGVVSGS
jgi:ADP-ribose pyrophosphatase YjhB (NUDIX family)